MPNTGVYTWSACSRCINVKNYFKTKIVQIICITKIRWCFNIRTGWAVGERQTVVTAFRKGVLLFLVGVNSRLL